VCVCVCVCSLSLSLSSNSSITLTPLAQRRRARGFISISLPIGDLQARVKDIDGERATEIEIERDREWWMFDTKARRLYYVCLTLCLPLCLPCRIPPYAVTSRQAFRMSRLRRHSLWSASSRDVSWNWSLLLWARFIPFYRSSRRMLVPLCVHLKHWRCFPLCWWLLFVSRLEA